VRAVEHAVAADVVAAVTSCKIARPARAAPRPLNGKALDGPGTLGIDWCLLGRVEKTRIKDASRGNSHRTIVALTMSFLIGERVGDRRTRVDFINPPVGEFLGQKEAWTCVYRHDPLTPGSTKVDSRRSLKVRSLRSASPEI